MPSRKKRVLSCSSSSSAIGSPPPDISSLSRQQRNQAEKQRRDKLNSFITELSSLVPMVNHSAKKLDKTSILRLTAAHLRLHYSPLNPQNKKSVTSWGPNILDSEKLNELMKAVDGFVVVATTSGKMLFVSRYVENYLGHQDIDMIGHSLMYFIHPDDHSNVKGKLKKLVTTPVANKSINNGETQVRSTFCARMRERCQPRSEVVNYHLMRFSCSYSIDANNNTFRSSNKSTAMVQRHRSGNGLCNNVLKMYIQSINPNPFDELSIAEAFQDEYVTQHSPMGEILYADHRISTITGHLPHEVIGMVAYDYIFTEDVPVAQFAQKLMFSSSNGTGMIVYRLKSRNATAVYLKSTGYLEYDKSSTKVTHFVCINKLLSSEEGEQELKKFNDRYSPRITEMCCSSTKSLFGVEKSLPIDCSRCPSSSEAASSPDTASQFSQIHERSYTSPYTVATFSNGMSHPSFQLSPAATASSPSLDLTSECQEYPLPCSKFTFADSTSYENFANGVIAVTNLDDSCLPSLTNGHLLETISPKGQKRAYDVSANGMIKRAFESKCMKYDTNHHHLQGERTMTITEMPPNCTLAADWRIPSNNGIRSYIPGSNFVNGCNTKDWYFPEENVLDKTVEDANYSAFDDVWIPYDSTCLLNSNSTAQSNVSLIDITDNSSSRDTFNDLTYDFAP